jgi:hypothetical protein
MRAPRHIERGLKAHDSRLAVRWDHQRSRWQIVEWLRRIGRWSHVFYWEGERGSYRPLDSLEAILLRLGRVDFLRFGQCAWSDNGLQVWAEQMEGKRTSWLRRRRAAYNLVLAEFRDMARRFEGEVVSSGPGGRLRARDWLRKEGLKGADVEAYLAGLK